MMKLLNLGGVFSIKTNNLATFATKIRAEILKNRGSCILGSSRKGIVVVVDVFDAL